MDEASVTALFCFVDDICINSSINTPTIPKSKKHTRQLRVFPSEVILVQILFHFSGFKNFKTFHCRMRNELLRYFPGLLSYTRFVAITSRFYDAIYKFILAIPCELDGEYVVDSTPIKVCHNKRIYSHKVFKDVAKRGKSTMGWFFGFKAHIVLNGKNELVNFRITPGNMDDRKVVESLMEYCESGTLTGDKGYISRDLYDKMSKKGIRLVRANRTKMKPQLVTEEDNMRLRKRNRIETANNELKNTFTLEHTRHRNRNNGFINMMGALAAYAIRKCLWLKKRYTVPLLIAA